MTKLKTRGNLIAMAGSPRDAYNVAPAEVMRCLARGTTRCQRASLRTHSHLEQTLESRERSRPFLAVYRCREVYVKNGSTNFKRPVIRSVPTFPRLFTQLHVQLVGQWLASSVSEHMQNAACHSRLPVSLCLGVPCTSVRISACNSAIILVSVPAQYSTRNRVLSCSTVCDNRNTNQGSRCAPEQYLDHRWGEIPLVP